MRVQEYQNGQLVREFDDGTPEPEPAPVDPSTVIASVAAMSDDEKAALREALGL